VATFPRRTAILREISRVLTTRSDEKRPLRGNGEPARGNTGADPVETALAEAVALAARAGQWSTVEILSRELGARRLARSAPDVLNLDAERARREK
jgi:hypothetical protein